MLFRYSICCGHLTAFFFFVIFVRPQNASLHSSCIYTTESLAFTHILHTYIHVFHFESTCNYQMAQRPFKNPLKALVTFRVYCFCVSFTHLIHTQKKNQTEFQLLYINKTLNRLKIRHKDLL